MSTDSFERLTSFGSLIDASHAASRGKRLSHEACAFLCEVEMEVLALQRELRASAYAPRPYRTFEIALPKPRTISAAAFRDRVVHHSLCAAIEPSLERYATDDSFACRIGRGTRAALRRAQHDARTHSHALKLDIRHFFETIDHDVLVRLIRRRVPEARTRRLAELFVRAGAPGSEAGKGMPIGNLTSQHFANLYLGPLDHYIRRTLRVPGYIRYMDDMLLFSCSKSFLWDCAASIEDFLGVRLSLILRPEVTRVLPVHEGIPFLGFRVFPGVMRLGPRRLRRFRRKMRGIRRAQSVGDLSDESAIASAQSLIGWVRAGDTQALLRADARGWKDPP